MKKSEIPSCVVSVRIPISFRDLCRDTCKKVGVPMSTMFAFLMVLGHLYLLQEYKKKD